MAKKEELYQQVVEQLGAENAPDYEAVTAKELEAMLGGGKPAGTLTVVNLRKNPVSVAGVQIKPEGSVQLTKEQMDDKRLMAKLQHGHNTGVFKLQ